MTEKYNMIPSAINWKKSAQDQWNKTPCGEIPGDKDTIEYFLTVQSNRYNDYTPWMKEFFSYSVHKNKKVLEIGYGQGTDLCQFALAKTDYKNFGKEDGLEYNRKSY